MTARRLNIEYEILKRNILIIMESLRAESERQASPPTVGQQFKFLACNIDQIDKLFKTARDDQEIEIMRIIITDNFSRERQIIQNLAIQIYRVTRSMAIEMIYALCRSSIEDELNRLQNDYDDVVKRCSAGDLVDDPDFQLVLELFSEHEAQQKGNETLFVDAKVLQDVDAMNQTITYDIPQELKTFARIAKTILKLQLKY